MLDLSDKHLAPAGHRAAQRLSAAPEAGESDLPRKGQRYRHFQGSIYEIEGLCTTEVDKAPYVLYRAVDPLLAGSLHLMSAAEFLGPQSKQTPGTPKYSPVHVASDTALRASVPDTLVPPHLREHVLSIQSSPLRLYHSREHVYHAFERAQAFELELTPEQKVALLFQDAVLVAGAAAGMNERLSAALLQDCASQMGQFDLEKASRIILDTAEHTATVAESDAVIALDLAYLADSPIQFCAADELVWLENRHLLDRTAARKDYDTRRLKYLLGLAKRGPLFPGHLKQLETAARDNLEGLRQAWLRKHPQDKKAN